MNLRYMIIKESKKNTLEERVQKKLEMGWKPQGGVSASISTGIGGSSELYCQAIIKE